MKILECKERCHRCVKAEKMIKFYAPDEKIEIIKLDANELDESTINIIWYMTFDEIEKLIKIDYKKPTITRFKNLYRKGKIKEARALLLDNQKIIRHPIVVNEETKIMRSGTLLSDLECALPNDVIRTIRSYRRDIM